jgi:tetratricopeptide (TPR) repeat protein
MSGSKACGKQAAQYTGKQPREGSVGASRDTAAAKDDVHAPGHTHTTRQATHTQPAFLAADDSAAFLAADAFAAALGVVPADDWCRTWAAGRTIMLRRTSKTVKAVVDKMRLPAVVRLSRSFWGDARNGTAAEKLHFVFRQLTLMSAWCRISTLELRRCEMKGQNAERLAGDGLGNCYDSLGQYAKSIDLFKQALVIAVELGDRAGQGATLHCLGFCCQKLGQYPKAMELFEQALAIDIELGDRAGQGATLNRLGNCYHRLGQYAKSMELFEQALAISEELGDRAGQGKTLHGIGNCYESLGQYAKAIDLFLQSLAIKEELGDRAGQRTTLNCLGNCNESC